MHCYVYIRSPLTFCVTVPRNTEREGSPSRDKISSLTARHAVNMDVQYPAQEAPAQIQNLEVGFKNSILALVS